jgi:hypothetical protein
MMITTLNRWSGEGNNGEIKSKDGFCKHHDARGRSEWSRCIEESEKATLVKEGREVSLIYTLDGPGP